MMAITARKPDISTSNAFNSNALGTKPMPDKKVERLATVIERETRKEFKTLTNEQMADVLRSVARILTERAAKEKG